MNNPPTWSLIVAAAEYLTDRGSTPFTMDQLTRQVQRSDPAREQTSIQPIVQGMTINARGGPKSACGEVLRRVDRGLYELHSIGPAGSKPIVQQHAPPRSSPEATVEDPIEHLRQMYENRSTLKDVNDIIEARDEVLNRYARLFAPTNLPNLTAEQFKSFLLYENNQHWWGIHRHQTSITKDMDHLRRVLASLLDERQPITERLDSIVRPFKANAVRGLGKAVFTPILLIVYPETYGVWNSIAESAMKRIGLWPSVVRGSTFGERYVAVNRVLVETAAEVGVDLWTLDALWWAIEQTANSLGKRPVSVPSSVHLTTDQPEFHDLAATSADQSFTLERHLHDFLRDNWNRTELGEEWELFSEGGDIVGYEYPTGVGRIDLLARHRTEPRWLVVELKRGQSSDTTVGQVARYVGWVSQHLAEPTETVEGLVISHGADDRLHYALSAVSNISLRTYEVEFRLRSHGSMQNDSAS